MPHLKEDKRLSTKRDRVRNVELINELFGKLFAQKPKEHWIELLERHKIPCGPINNVKEVVESPQVQARGMIVELEHRRREGSRWRDPPSRRR